MPGGYSVRPGIIGLLRSFRRSTGVLAIRPSAGSLAITAGRGTRAPLTTAAATLAIATATAAPAAAVAAPAGALTRFTVAAAAGRRSLCLGRRGLAIGRRLAGRLGFATDQALEPADQARSTVRFGGSAVPGND